MTPENSYVDLHRAFGDHQPEADGVYIFDRSQMLCQVAYLKQHQPGVATELVRLCDALFDGQVEMPFLGAKVSSDGRPLHHIQPRLSFLSYLPWASAISGDTKYDTFGCEAFDAWYAEKGDYNQLSVEGKRAVLKGPSHGLMLESLCRFHQAVSPDVMTDKQGGRLQLAMVQHADVLYREREILTYSNVYAFKLLGALSVSVTLPQWKDGQAARDNMVSELIRCLLAQFRRDGGHVEQSPNYARAVLHLFAIFFRICDANAIAIEPELLALYRQAGLAHWDFNIGNGESLPFGDSTQRNLHYGMAWWALGLPRGEGYQIPHATHPDWVVAGLSEHFHELASCPPLPPLRSAAQPDSGYYFMRPSNPSGDATVMAVDAGPHGYYHGHFDLLSVVLYHQGQPILPDPGRHPYDSSADRQACLSTLWHSAPCLDMENHHAWDDGEPPLAQVDAWDVAENGECYFSAWHDGYAHWVGAPRVQRQIWYDGVDVWVIVDRFWCQNEARRARPLACISTFNLPTAEVAMADNYQSLRTDNALIVIANSNKIDHINIIPGVHETAHGRMPGKRLALVTNGDAVCHVMVVHAFADEPHVLSIDTEQLGADLKVQLTQNGVARQLTFPL